MSCSALSLSSGRVQLASDFRGGELCVPSCQNGPLKVVHVFRRQRLVASELSFAPHCEISGRTTTLSVLRSHGRERYRRLARSFVTDAIPTEAISAAAAIVLVAGSAGALTWLNQDKLKVVVAEKPKCEACNGSGLCSSCNGEGFQLKNLSPEAASRARAKAKNAATRYTAGLAKKWSYCTNCSGSRNCPECSGSGSLTISQTGN